MYVRIFFFHGLNENTTLHPALCVLNAVQALFIRCLYPLSAPEKRLGQYRGLCSRRTDYDTNGAEAGKRTFLG